MGFDKGGGEGLKEGRKEERVCMGPSKRRVKGRGNG